MKKLAKQLSRTILVILSLVCFVSSFVVNVQADTLNEDTPATAPGDTHIVDETPATVLGDTHIVDEMYVTNDIVIHQYYDYGEQYKVTIFLIPKIYQVKEHYYSIESWSVAAEEQFEDGMAYSFLSYLEKQTPLEIESVSDNVSGIQPFCVAPPPTTGYNAWNAYTTQANINTLIAVTSTFASFAVAFIGGGITAVAATIAAENLLKKLVADAVIAKVTDGYTGTLYAEIRQSFHSTTYGAFRQQRRIRYVAGTKFGSYTTYTDPTSITYLWSIKPC